MRGRVEKHDDTQPKHFSPAPDGPGSKPRWTSGAKTAAGTAASRASRVWFTIGQGVLNEIYFPEIDKANTRTIRFLIADGANFFSDEEHDADHTVTAFAPGIPGYSIVSLCKHGRYRLTKTIVSDPARDVVLMDVCFEPLEADSSLNLYLFAEPHVEDQGAGNSAWIGTYQGLAMMFAARGTAALAIFTDSAFLSSTCGFVGSGDAYEQLKAKAKLTEFYNCAQKGNVSICAEIDWRSNSGRFRAAVGFGLTPAEAGQQARAGVLTDFAKVKQHYTEEWQAFQKRCLNISAPAEELLNEYRISTAMLQTHESKQFPGGFIASLSMPWGFARGDEDTGAYHVLWPRDLCESAMGLMASGYMEAGRHALFYLTCTQKHDGSWSQNIWLDGTEHWGAVQMDGIAMPILLADQLRRSEALEGYDAWPMIQKATQFLVRMGPGTSQDRWEALSGYSTFTIACEVAALLAAADFADLAGANEESTFLRETADAWNDALDTLTYASRTPLAKDAGVPGYYLRITPNDAIERTSLDDLWLTLANHPVLRGHHRATEVVSPDALALVRFGLRSAKDPRMQATAAVIDHSLRREMTTGPGWIRSTGDGYGEHGDGTPYDGHGVGHCWPLLAGERGHFALADGDRTFATEILHTMTRQTSACGMIPEQVWSAPDIPEHELYNGHPAGSGMPLAWAHAEYVKLLRSLDENRVWDTPPQTVDRYQVQGKHSNFEIWTEHEPRHWITQGRDLRMDFNEPSIVTWNVGGESHTQRTAQPVCALHSLILKLPAGWTHLSIETEQHGIIQQRTLVPR